MMKEELKQAIKELLETGDLIISISEEPIRFSEYNKVTLGVFIDGKVIQETFYEYKTTH